MKGYFPYVLVFNFVLCLLSETEAQTLLPLNRSMEQRVEKEMLLHEVMLPPVHSYYREDIEKVFDVDSLLVFSEKRHRTWVGRKLWDESFIKIDSTDYQLHINPLFNLQVGKTQDGGSTFINTRGVMVSGKLGKKFSFGSWVYENQARLPVYWDKQLDSTRVMPGQGRAKRFGKTGWDYAYSGGYISWRALKSLNLEFGQGKNFIGNGYRSMVLSDVSSNYPYFRIDWKYKNLHYTKSFNAFTNLYYPFTDIREFYKKTGTFQMLNLKLGKKLQIAFFDLNIWDNPDSTGNFRWRPGMFIPVPYFTSLRIDNGEEILNSVDGINISYTPFRGILLYGQALVDEWPDLKSAVMLKFQKFAYQVGFKYYDFLGMKELFVQFELNEASPFTYSHFTSNLAMSHFQQPLAHPLGANFREGVSIVNYRYKRIFFETKLTVARYGADGINTHWGKNILKPHQLEIISSDIDHPRLFQGISTNLNTSNVEISYLINANTNMNVTLGFYMRNEKSELVNNQTKMFYFSFKTALNNIYFDY